MYRRSIKNAAADEIDGQPWLGVVRDKAPRVQDADRICKGNIETQ